MAPDPLAVPRLIVVQPTRPSGLPYAWLSVGVLRWWGPEPRMTVVAKASFDYAPRRGKPDELTVPRLAGSAPKLSLDEDGSEGPDELFYASDFVPRKEGTDLMLVGHAFAAELGEGEAPPRRIECELGVPDLHRRFDVGVAEPSEAVALRAATVKTVGADADRGTGPMRLDVDPGRTHPEDYDFSTYNAAPGWLRAPALAADADVELLNLSRHAPKRRLRLPGLVSQVAAELPWMEDFRAIDMALDTVWLDTDHEVMTLCWRGSLPVQSDGSEIARLLVSLERADQPRSLEVLRSRVAGGRAQYALGVADLRPGADPVPTQDARLRAARTGMMLEGPGEPELTLQQYAQLSAELSEEDDADGRRAVLERREWDEERWAFEERSWLDKMSQEALDGGVTLTAQYSEYFTAAQDELCKPGEGKRTVKDLAAILVEMETATDPMQPLTERKMNLAQLMRLQRRLVKEQTEDSAVAIELQQEIDRLRKQREAAETQAGEDPGQPA